jgi:hypothetical protein
MGRCLFFGSSASARCSVDSISLPVTLIQFPAGFPPAMGLFLHLHFPWDTFLPGVRGTEPRCARLGPCEEQAVCNSGRPFAIR